MSDHKYKLKYEFKKGEWTRDEVDKIRGESDCGFTDQIVVISIIDHEDGGGSYLTFSVNGHTGKECEPHRIWHAWAALAKALSEHPGLSDSFRAVTTRAHHHAKAVILS